MPTVTTAQTFRGSCASERDTAYQLDISWRRNRAVPDSETCAGWIVVKRNAIAERLAIAGEVVIVEQIENFGAHFHVEPLLERKFLGDRKIGIAIRRAANRADARPGAKVIPIGKQRTRFERRGVKHGLVHIDRAPRLRQHLAADSGNTCGLELRGNAAKVRVPEVERHSGSELHAGRQYPAAEQVVGGTRTVQPPFPAAEWQIISSH